MDRATEIIKAEMSDLHSRIAELEALLIDTDLYLGILQLVPSDDDHAASVRDLRRRIKAALKRKDM